MKDGGRRTEDGGRGKFDKPQLGTCNVSRPQSPVSTGSAAGREARARDAQGLSSVLRPSSFDRACFWEVSEVMCESICC